MAIDGHGPMISWIAVYSFTYLFIYNISPAFRSLVWSFFGARVLATILEYSAQP